MHIDIFNVAVRPREIYVLHRAHCVSLILGVFSGPDSVVVYGDNLARFHVPDVLCPDHAERTGLAADYVSVTEPSERKRPQSVFVTAGVDAVLGHYQECECAFYHIEGLHYRENPRGLALERVLLDEVGENLAVGGGLEEAAPVLEIFAELDGVDQVAVVGQCEISGIVPEEERLDVLDSAATGGGVADVAHCHAAFQAGEIVIVEHLGDEALALDSSELAFIIDRDYSAAFLPPVLEGVKAVVGDFGGILHAIDAEDAAFFVNAPERSLIIVIHRNHCYLSPMQVSHIQSYTQGQPYLRHGGTCPCPASSRSQCPRIWRCPG